MSSGSLHAKPQITNPGFAWPSMVAESENPAPAGPPDGAEASARPGGTTAPEAPQEEDWATRFRYLLADFENYRKRVERDTEHARLRSRISLLRELLPLFEATQRAHASIVQGAPSDPIRKGVELISQEFAAFMDREGVEPVAELGGHFDPASHEAVGETPARDGVPDGTIGSVVQQGYRIPGGLLRPAKVLIARDLSKGPPATEAPAPGHPELEPEES